MSFAQPISNIESALQKEQVSDTWWKGRAVVEGVKAVFFARTQGELVFKYRQWMKQFRRQAHPDAGATTFRDKHGFGAGDRVRYSPDYSAAGYNIGTLRQPHRTYVIGMTGYQGDGSPVAWLNGVRGCVPISQLSHVKCGGDAA